MRALYDGFSKIYDQSPKGNHLTPAPPGSAHYPLPDKPANATVLSTTVGGHGVYGVLIEPGMGYRNDKTSGIATGDQPETLYMVTSSKNLVNSCCFDYGNAETNNLPDGAGSMEAVYFGLGARQGVASTGTGTGPWVQGPRKRGLGQGFRALYGRAPRLFDEPKLRSCRRYLSAPREALAHAKRFSSQRGER